MGQSQTSRSLIAAGQLEDLRGLVAELFPGNRFYAGKLNALGVTFDVASLADFSERFPFTTKPELAADQSAHPPFGTNLTYPLERYTRCHQTSGTSGTPLRWLDTPESWAGMTECWTEVWRAAGARPGDRAYFAFSFGPFIGFWLAFESAARLGCMCLPGGGLSSVARLRAILDNGVTLLCCTPTYALRLAEVAAEEGISLRSSRVRALIVAGEPGGSIPAVRSRLEELWPGSRVSDHHGLTETGPLSYECPRQPGVLHVIESAYYTEVIDLASGKPTRPGEIGELVVTTLGRTGSPLLRYRTGDLVRPVAEGVCACGCADLALAGGILGRADDMVVVRGVNVYPSAVEELVRRNGGVAEYQVELSSERGLTELHLRVEPRPDHPDSERLVTAIQNEFEIALALRVAITIAPPGSLPRFEMKARRWVRR